MRSVTCVQTSSIHIRCICFCRCLTIRAVLHPLHDGNTVLRLNIITLCLFVFALRTLKRARILITRLHAREISVLVSP